MFMVGKIRRVHFRDPDHLFFAVSPFHGVLLASKGRRTHLPAGGTFHVRLVVHASAEPLADVCQGWWCM